MFTLFKTRAFHSVLRISKFTALFSASTIAIKSDTVSDASEAPSTVPIHIKNKRDLELNLQSDEKKIMEIVDKWPGLEQKVKPTLRKYLISVFGCTSSGKSSFVNHI